MGSVEDPETGEVIRCGVYGEFVFKIVDPAKLILNLVGTQTISSNDFIIDAIKDQLTKILRATVNNKLKAEQWSLIDVTSGTYTLEFEKTIVDTAVDYLEPFGVQITRIEDFLVNMDDSDRQRLLELKDRIAKMRLTGDPRYMAAAQTEAMFGAAEGMAQGGNGANMAGMFVGAGLGQTVGGGIAAGQVQEAAQQAAKEEAAAASGAAAGTADQTTVACPQCGTANAADAKFCSNCGTALGPKHCTNCGAELPSDAKFCSDCGTAQS
jgi:membrane protease subunit (stomatin/prohibitin family)